MAVRVIPSITIAEGKAREAIPFYEKVLGGKNIGIVSYGDMPADPQFPLPVEAKNRVAHTMIEVGDSALILADEFPGQPVQKGDQVTICLMPSDADEARRMFDALQEGGGEVQMPLQATYWTPAFGVVKDRFGVSFMISAQAAAEGGPARG